MLQVSVLTPEKELFQGEVLSFIAPGVNGSFQVLNNHASMITLLPSGVVTLTVKEGVTKSFSIVNGTFEISQNRALILGEQIEALN